ncbi:cilia- and flagella-associated protein 206-like [Sitophilus oryzae]|uniref:Cilia- and flagella-associated protein 206 n=1 Tax=Sitophilus oryzae TaxID=7048 RepID=A0A6J2YL90_SITOR|nr:cilia- and flagella-associated protein 206-like [Sitophilus oryzae]
METAMSTTKSITDDTDHIVRNVLSEILRECKNRNIEVIPEFLVYYIELCRLDPQRGLFEANITNRQNTQAFIKHTVSKLKDKKNRQIATLKIQFLVTDHVQKGYKLINSFRRETETKLHPLLMNIVEQDKKNTIEILYKKISIYAILASGMGNPANSDVLKEAKQVVKSIVEVKEMKTFPSVTNYIKQEVVKTIADLSMGIRLYNKECKKGGYGIKDMPKLLNESIAKLRRKIILNLVESEETSKAITKLILAPLNIKDVRDEYVLEIACPTINSKLKWIQYKDLGTLYRQWIKSARELLVELNKIDDNLQAMISEYHEVIKYLREIVVPQLYMLVKDVFPHFIHLSQIWKEIQDTALYVQELWKLFLALFQTVVSVQLDLTLEEESQMMKWIATKDEPLLTSTTNPYVTIYHDAEQLPDVTLEFDGYCCWALVNVYGALIKGNPKFGIIKYNNKFYCFCCKLAANRFAVNPEEFIIRTVTMARKYFQLISYLNINDLMMEYKGCSGFETEAVDHTHKHDLGTQTEVHIEKSNMVFGYKWNVWSYRREAITGNALLTAKTTSCMTNRMHSKAPCGTQTYGMKRRETQTTTDDYCNTIKPLKFIHGLRGNRKSKTINMDLTEIP